MTNRKKGKKNYSGSQATAAGKDNTLLVSSKLMADLKNKGIMAFKQMTEAEQKRVWSWAKEVVRQYRNTLESDPGNIRDIEDLPFCKEDIMLAIKLMLPLYLSKNMHSMVRVLKAAYNEIGSFQSIDSKVKEQVSSLRAGKARVTSKQHQDIFRAFDRCMQVAVSEKKVLLREITDFLIDLEH